MRNIASKTELSLPLQISQNLYDFLAVARRKRWLHKWFWIDALCIDQSNTTERSHQVAHMGHIYAHALKVIVWLGQTSTQFTRSLSEADFDEWRSFVLENEYWNRAWITQEIVLARKVAVLINEKMTSLRKVVNYVSDGLTDSWLWSPMRGLVNTGLLLRFGESKPHLLDLLKDKFWADKDCSIARDRVFSILELVQEGKNILVDYNATPIDLARNILSACSHVPCPCSVLALLRALGIDEPIELSLLSEFISDVLTPHTISSHHFCKGIFRVFTPSRL